MYEHLIAYVNSQFWALERSKFDAMRAVLALRASGQRLTDKEIAANIEAAGGRADGPLIRAWDVEAEDWSAAAQAPAAGRQSVAVIGVYGVLAHRAGGMGEMSGGTSTERLAAAISQAANDSSVKGIVLDLNSPGGAVEGVTECAAAIRAARAVKPVEGVVNAHAESGGYWIGSAADYLTAIPSAMIGSLGIFAAHTDTTKAEELRGEKTVVVRDTVLSKYKAEGLDGPLSDEAIKHLESVANSYADMFKRDVAKNRGVSVDTVVRDFGQGRSLPAKAALSAKMIDGIGSLDDAIRRVARGATVQRNAAAAAEAPELAVVAIGPEPPTVTLTPGPAAFLTDEQAEAYERMRSL